MTDLRKLSEAATPGKLHYDRPCNEIWAGAYNEHTIAEWVSRGDGEYICALWNEHRSGSLIPRSEYERLQALLVEAREALAQYQRDLCEGFCRDLPTREYFEEDMAIDCAACRSRATLSRIDDALAADPEARG